ncbi:MAG TPA: 2-C-methyl-D-erythritol 2,4-cyclodiphosphate synthase [Chloroflexota bacterium]|nr:2-C-methyl-D-erythritol 2,4-cyclodiphosphate synthase [Chloroflexota bacterium]
MRQAESPFRTGPRREPTTRIGVGYDVHRLGEGRPLHLGGVSIPYHLGLVGHSDADVLVHAVMDALLGAAGLHDIGHYFPNDDPHWKGASSIDMLTTVMCELRRSRFEVENVDSTIIAEEPKLAPYIPEMRRRIATALGTNPSCVGVKATTAEGTGPEGRGESIAVHSVALIRQR